MKYQPLGKKVLLKILPPKQEGKIVVPDHLQKANVTGQQQFFRVEGFGLTAVSEEYPLAVGQIVMISTHPTLLVGVDVKESLCVCNNNDIACICTEEDTPGLN